MAQILRLELRQGAALVMTPQLQQSIKLLQLSNLELAQFVEGELRTNPLIEQAEGEEGEDGPGSDAAPADEPAVSAEDAVEANLLGEGPAESRSHAAESHGSGEANLPAPGKTLREHLIEQLNADITHPIERLVGLHLIDGLDEAGYLATPLEEIAERLGSRVGAIEPVLHKLQRFDPPGVFARSLRECLKLQLEDRNRLEPAMAVLLDHLELIAAGEYDKLATLCGVSPEGLRALLDELRTLAPKPGLAFDPAVVHAVVPDVIVKSTPDGWHIELNAATLPRVLIDHSYYLRLKDSARTREDKAYIAERFQSASWLVKALDQRARTILKVARELVARQGMFLRHGIEHLRPLTLRDIAESIGVHESTVSRVIQNKFVLTPRGTFELKYFFSTSLESLSGGDAHSAETVRHRIRQLIEDEDAASPLSDDHLALRLKAEGIAIARRTVAKYRESMRLGSSVERRRLKKRRSLHS